MLTCPFCESENIDGADECEDCGQPLIVMSMPRPATRLEKSLVKDRIEELEPREPLVCHADASVGWVIKLMYDHKVGAATIVDGDGRPIGIFTDRDALMRLGPDAASLADRPIADYMTRDPSTLEADDKIAFALHRMDLGGYRHVPITSQGTVSGIISVRDILKYVDKRLLPAESA